jgi:hypothetical protein
MGKYILVGVVALVGLGLGLGYYWRTSQNGNTLQLTGRGLSSPRRFASARRSAGASKPSKRWKDRP